MVGTAVTAALALGNAIYGGITSARANNKARRLIQQQREDNKKWYDTEMAKDYTLRTDTQAAINRQRELLEEQYKQARARQAVSGGSDESTALAKEAPNRSLSDTITDIASQASAHKDRIEQQYRAQDAALNQQQAQSYQQQAAQTAQAASQAVNAGISLTGQLAAEPNTGRFDSAGWQNTRADAAARAAAQLPGINTQGNIITDFTPNKEALLKAPAGDIIIKEKK